MNGTLSLDQFNPPDVVLITNVRGSGIVRRRMLDLGLVPGTRVEIIRRSPLGDPTAYKIRGAIIALRREESSQIYAAPLKN